MNIELRQRKSFGVSSKDVEVVVEESSQSSISSTSASSKSQKRGSNVAQFKDSNDSLTGRSLTCINDTSFPYRDISYFDGADCAYFADISQWKRKTPDIRLHHSRSEGFGAIAGESYFRWNPNRPKFGLGSPEEISTTWIEAENKCAWKKKLRFEWEGKKYAVSRVGKEECRVLGMKYMWGNHLKVVEEDRVGGEGKLVAMRVCEKMGCKKRGTLRFAEGVSEELEVLIVLAVTTRKEMQRRE